LLAYSEIIKFASCGASALQIFVENLEVSHPVVLNIITSKDK